jgi:tetratricopeptide (TPR) repeat protein
MSHLRSLGFRVVVVSVLLIAVAGMAVVGSYLLWLRSRLPGPGSPAYEQYVEAFQVGVAALDADVPQKAEENLTRAIDLVPQEPAAWADRGLLYLRTNRFDEAFRDLQRASVLAPNNLEVVKLLGLLDQRRGRFGDAAAHLRRAVEGDPHDIEALYRLKLADANPAVMLFRRDLGYSHHNIGDLLARQDSWTEAITAYREALTVRQKLAEANPTVTDYQRDLASTLSHLGIAQRRGGRPAAAAASFRKAIVIMEGLPTLTPGQHYELACYRALLAEVAAASGSGVTAAEGQAAADQALAALRQAVDAGYRTSPI